MTIQGWFSLGLTGLITLQSKGLSKVFSNTTVQNINSSVLSLLDGPTLTCKHDYWKKHSFDCMDLCWQSNVSLLFNTLCRFVIAFLPRSKRLLISLLQSLTKPQIFTFCPFTDNTCWPTGRGRAGPHRRKPHSNPDDRTDSKVWRQSLQSLFTEHEWMI